MNSQATSVASLKLHQVAIAACLVFWREICHASILEFCNTICQQETLRAIDCPVGAPLTPASVAARPRSELRRKRSSPDLRQIGPRFYLREARRCGVKSPGRGRYRPCFE